MEPTISQSYHRIKNHLITTFLLFSHFFFQSYKASLSIFDTARHSEVSFFHYTKACLFRNTETVDSI